MSEAASSEPDSEAEQPQPEALSAKRAVSTVSSYAQLALGSFATFSGLLYAMGYLLTLGQMRMLGVGAIDVSNQEIVHKVISIPLLSVLCAIAALSTLEGLLVGAALLLVCLFSRRLGLFLQEDVGPRTWRGLVLQWFGPLLLLLLVGLHANVLAGKVLEQRDLLLKIERVSANESDHEVQLPWLLAKYPVEDLAKLKSFPDAGRTVYGFQVLSVVFCLTILVGLWITSRHSDALSWFHDKGAQLMLSAAGLLVLFMLLNMPFLYGYLVMDTKFRAVETRMFPDKDSSKYLPKDTGIRLLILGSSSKKHTVYSLEHQQMWSGVGDDKLLPAKQISEIDPFKFDNPFPRPEQIKSVSGRLVACDGKEIGEMPIPEDYWIEILSVLLPAESDDDEADMSKDPTGYRANWIEIGSLVATKYTGDVFRLTLYEVFDQQDGEHRHYLMFKLTAERGEGLLAITDGDESDFSQESTDQESDFEGRIYSRCDEKRELFPGSYFECGGDPVRLKNLLLEVQKPEGETEKPDSEVEKSGAEKPDAEPTEQPAADANESAAKADEPSAEGDHSAEVDKTEVEPDTPAAKIDKPKANPNTPAAEIDKTEVEPDAGKPTETKQDQPKTEDDYEGVKIE